MLRTIKIRGEKEMKKIKNEQLNNEYAETPCKHCGKLGGLGKCYGLGHLGESYKCDNLQCGNEGCRIERGIDAKFNYAIMEEGSFWCDDCLEKYVKQEDMDKMKKKYGDWLPY